jgi:aryl-alcohol dehydrogenase-like predicted oxidoreductase
MQYFKDGKPNPEWLRKLDAIREILTSNGRTLAQGALAWIWARSEQTVPIPGFRTVRQVEENCAAMQFGPLSAEQMREIDMLLRR